MKASQSRLESDKAVFLFSSVVGQQLFQNLCMQLNEFTQQTMFEIVGWLVPKHR